MKLTKNPVFKYFVEAKEELEKVTWPTQKETTRYTALVIGICLGAAAFLGALDLASQYGIEGLLNLAQSAPAPAATVQSTDGSTTINLDDITSNGGEVTVTPADDTGTTDDTVDAQ